MVFQAFLFGRRAKTTQLRYIWTRIIYLFIYLFISGFKNILIRVDRAFDSLSLFLLSILFSKKLYFVY